MARSPLLLLLLLLLAFSVLRRVDQRLVCLRCEVAAWLGGGIKMRRNAITALTMLASVAGAHSSSRRSPAQAHARHWAPPPPPPPRGSGSACSPGAFQSARTC